MRALQRGDRFIAHDHGRLSLQLKRGAPRTAAAHAVQQHRAAPTRLRAVELLEGRMPLVGAEGLAAALPPPLRSPLQLHTFVLLDAGPGEAWFFDFLPEAPTAPTTAAALLSGQSVRGTARRRRLLGTAPKHLPAGASLRRVATLACCDAVAVASAFTDAWAPELSLARRNCRHHTAALIAALLAAEAETANAEGAAAAGAD